MHTAITVVIYIVVLSFMFLAGYMTSFFIRKRRSYSGIMKVIKEDDRVLYSLELNNDPMIFEYAKEVVFKVETSDESSDRK